MRIETRPRAPAVGYAMLRLTAAAIMYRPREALRGDSVASSQSRRADVSVRFQDGLPYVGRKRARGADLAVRS